jgi:hypothetical protein
MSSLPYRETRPSLLVPADAAEYSIDVVISIVPEFNFVICECVMTFHTSVITAIALETEVNNVKT